MCILCDHGALEFLTTPLDRLGPGQLAEAIRTAREAAGPGVIAYAEEVLRGKAMAPVGSELYGEAVVDRAVEAGVLERSAAYGWGARPGETDALDPRVLAFVSSCAEIIDDYHALEAERRQVVERFLEAHGGAVRFARLGTDGELWFEYDGAFYAVLTQVEARTIAEREIGATLHAMKPDALLRYTTLPDTALDTLAEIQSKPAATANAILADLVELAVLADDRVRAAGYAPFFEEDPSLVDPDEAAPAEDLRFGEWVIIRTA